MTLLRQARCFSPSSSRRIFRQSSIRVVRRRTDVLSIRHAEPPSSQNQRPFPPEAVQSLLRSALSRSKRTLSEKNDYSTTSNTREEEAQEGVDLTGLLSSITETDTTTTTTNSSTTRQQQQTDITNNLLTSITSRSKRTLSTTRNLDKESSTIKEEEESKAQFQSSTANNASFDIDPAKFTTTDLRYNQNPGISLTALAHWLWSSVLRPHDDSAIDATCGNGHDSVGIASVLFASEDLYLYKNAELICIDVQAQACQKTQEALAKVIPPWILSKQVQIIEASHASLPVPIKNKEPGLVVYNLGYLPNSQADAKDQTTIIKTQIDSTLASITDALLMIRVGGMVSIMTYPATNRNEDAAVRTLLESTVALTNKKDPSWEETIAQQQFNENDNDDVERIKSLLTQQLERMTMAYKNEGVTRTFRVTEHKKIGLDSAPILMTATRIK